MSGEERPIRSAIGERSPAIVSARYDGLRAWILWTGMLLLVAAVIHPAREELDQAHVALTFLLVVLGGSAGGGRALGFALSFAGVLLIDYYFQPPFDTFTVGKPLDWVALLAFLATAVVATQLLAEARAAAAKAHLRAIEIDRFSTLGAETINAARAEDALVAIAAVIRESMGVRVCELYVRDTATGALALGARVDAAEAGVTPPGADQDEKPESLPLLVRDREVGSLVLYGERHTDRDPALGRALEALAYYAALGVERVRLASEAEHANALREADRLKDALLASVSHDLRTPLTTIKALAHEIAARGEPRAEVIEEQADRLNDVVADLLEWSRLAAGGGAARPEVNAIEDLVGAALRQAHAAMRAHEVVTDVGSSEPVLVARFDFVQSLRVLTNLLENAAKYSPPGSIIEVAARRVGTEVTLSVADRGSGVPIAERDRIFTPFYRPPHTAPDVGGVGLGLAIARRLAELQGGSLTLEPRPGGGSVFTLTVSAADIERDASEGAASSSDAPEALPEPRA